MTTVAASSSSSFPMPHREASLPPLRYLFGQQAPAPTSRRSERTGEEEDEALPLLVSMYAQRREAEPKQQLPTISSMLSGGRCPSPTSSRPMMTPPPEARASSSSPVPQPSPSSPSSLSPGLFVLTTSSSSSSSASSSPSSKSFSSTSSSTGSSSPSSSPLSFSSPSSPSSSAEGAVANHAYASATNSLMELSDIISSMPALQNLPVPSAPLNDSPSSPASLGGDADGNDNDDDPDYRATSPVSSRTRRVTRRSRMQQQKQQQLQIERIRSELEQERDRARDLQRELQLALQERAELLQLKGDVPPAAMQAVDNSINAASGLSFLNVLNEEGGSQLVFAHLPRANSLPSFFSGFADADTSDLQHVSSSSSELGLRSRSAPMLPPIGSVPALSPYLKRKRASLPAGADSGARRSLSPASSPLRPSTRVSFSCGDSAESRPSRRRRLAGYGEEEDEDYEPTASANSKKIKRSRSISEGGRRLTQASSNAREGRRRSHQQFGDYAAGYDHAEAAAAFIASRRARAIEDQSSRASMDVVEGADQEDDDGSAATTTTTTTAPEFQRRDSVLCFIKDHPHASFWLSRGKARN